jgi:hypothetical protein
MVVALLVGALVAWSVRRAESPADSAFMVRRVVAAGVPFVVLVALLFVALARTWSRFDALEVAVGEEAGAALAVGRLAAVLPAESREAVRHHVRSYLQHVVDDEFPAMTRGETPAAASTHLDALAASWSDAHVPPEFAVEAFRSIDAIHTGRSRRAAAVSPSVPPSAFVIGLVALIASVRVASSAFVGPLAVRSLVTTLLVFTTLAAALLVSQFSLPFAGDLTVDVDPFVDAENALGGRSAR